MVGPECVTCCGDISSELGEEICATMYMGPRTQETPHADDIMINQSVFISGAPTTHSGICDAMIGFA